MVIPKIGLRLTFQPLSVFLILESAMIAAIIIAARTLIPVGEDTYRQTVVIKVNKKFHTLL